MEKVRVREERKVKIKKEEGAQLMDRFKNRRHAPSTLASLLIKPVS